MNVHIVSNETLTEEDIAQAQQDFFYACDSVREMLDDFAEQDLFPGAALTGALTQLVANLFSMAPSDEIAMKMLSSCIDNATAFLAEEQTSHKAGANMH